MSQFKDSQEEKKKNLSHSVFYSIWVLNKLDEAYPH